ncbi:MAG: SDR family NAD(P)-dependent oxidoreductase [Halobacteriaceae archaeon]
MASANTAIVAGVGPGLGASVARRFAAEGCSVGLFARSTEFVDELAADIRGEGGDAVGVPTDVTDPDEIEHGVERVRDAFGPIDVLVNNAGGGGWAPAAELDADGFEAAWRTCAYAGFACTKAVLEDMLVRDPGGTVIFTGATSGVRGRGDAAGFASAKFAVRGLAESLARELGPEGVHVAHVVVDGQILPPEGPAADRDAEEYLDPDAIAESYWHLVEQDRSSWTLELDLRPHVEEF